MGPARAAVARFVARLGALGRIGWSDFVDEWRFASARALLTVAAMWLLWLVTIALFTAANLAVNGMRAEIDRAQPMLAQWVDARAWDGMAPATEDGNRWGPLDPCAPTRLTQWTNTGSWHPTCLSLLPNGSLRRRAVAAPESLMVELMRVEVAAMVSRHERPGTASLQMSSRVPSMWRRLLSVRVLTRGPRIFAWACLAFLVGVLFLAVHGTAARRDATTALREVLGQRPFDTWWALSIELAAWTALCSGVPLFFWRIAGHSVISLGVAAAGGYLLSVGLLAWWRSLRRRRLSIAARLALGAD